MKPGGYEEAKQENTWYYNSAFGTCQIMWDTVSISLLSSSYRCAKSVRPWLSFPGVVSVIFWAVKFENMVSSCFWLSASLLQAYSKSSELQKVSGQPTLLATLTTLVGLDGKKIQQKYMTLGWREHWLTALNHWVISTALCVLYPVTNNHKLSGLKIIEMYSLTAEMKVVAHSDWRLCGACPSSSWLWTSFGFPWLVHTPRQSMCVPLHSPLCVSVLP